MPTRLHCRNFGVQHVGSLPTYIIYKHRRLLTHAWWLAVQVRMMLAMSVRCSTCGNYMYKGTKFTMRMEVRKLSAKP